MIDPRIWAGTPHKNTTAWLDLVGQMELFMRALAQKTFQETGNTFRVLPLGSGGGQDWLYGVQQMYNEAAEALGESPPADLASYDLDRAEDFASWTFLLGQTTRSLQNAAGLV